MGALAKPEVADPALRRLFDALHDLHHRAGWPSLRDMAREAGCSRTTIAAAFSEPRLPRWGLLEILVETLSGDTRAFHALWLDASGSSDSPPTLPDAATPAAMAARQTAAVPRELPADVAGFVGRTDELAALDTLADQAASAPAVGLAAICGTAGVGKTALAVHWGHRVADRFPDGQLYVNLRGYDPDAPVRAADALEILLRTLGMPGRDIPPNVEERAARYRTLLAGRRMLILLDNAHSVDQVRDLLPGTPMCLVIVTSRDSLPGLVARHGAARVNLDLLPPAEAYTLLRTLIGARADAIEGTTAVAERCARLPLALRVAAELAVSRPAVPLAQLADELSDSGRLDMLTAGGDEYTAVRAVLSRSLRHLSPAAATAFTLLGLHPGGPVDLAAAAAVTGMPTPEARRAAGDLVRAHLLDDLGGGRFAMHDLLMAYAAEQTDALDRDVRDAALTRLLDHYLSTARAAVGAAFATDAPQPPAPALFSDGSAAVRWLDTVRPTLLALARTAAHASPVHTVDLSAVLAPYLDAHGHYTDARALHGLAVAACRTGAAAELDRTAAGRATSLLATACRRTGDYRDAIAHYCAALAQHRAADDRPYQARTLHGLGVSCWRLGQHAEAIDHLTASLALYRETGDRAGEGGALYALGLSHLQLGHYDEAIRKHENALTVQRAAGDRIGEGRTLNNLGMVLHRLGRTDEARAHVLRALAIARHVGNRTGEGVARANLGDFAAELGDLEDAADHHTCALTLFRQIGYRLGQAEALRGLGIVARRQGHPNEALTHLEAAIELVEHVGEREVTIQVLVELGAALRAAGRLDEALRRHRAASDLADSTNDPYLRAQALAGLAAVLTETGDHAGAQRYRDLASTLRARAPQAPMFLATSSGT